MSNAIATEEFEALRYDQGSIKNFERSDEGFLIIRGIATKTGVFPYRNADGTTRWELRHPDEVLKADSLKTLGGKPFTLNHPPGMLDPSNVASYQAGSVANKVQVHDDGLVEVVINVHREDAIAAIENGTHRELSPGYRCKVVREDGVYKGQRFTHRQTAINYNHLSGVERARAGPLARLRYDAADGEVEIDVAVQMDAAESECKRNSEFVNTEADSTFSGNRMTQLHIDGVTYSDVPDGFASQVAPKLKRLDEAEDTIDQLTQARADDARTIAELQAQITQLTADRDRESGRADSLEYEVEDLKFKVEELEEAHKDSADEGDRMDEAQIQERIQSEVQSRIDALDDGRQLLAQHDKADVKLDASMDPLTIQRTVIDSICPGQDVADEDISGFYKALKLGAVRSDAAATHHADTLERTLSVVQGSNPSKKASSKRQDAMDERKKAHRKPLAMSKNC